MTKALAYCVELKRNISLKEAHFEFFGQPSNKRKRLTFQCGDQVCRANNPPLIVAALYDREDAFNEKFKSPYFREHAAHAHIVDCTWITGVDIKRIAEPGIDSDPVVSKVVVSKLGLIFKISKTTRTTVKIDLGVNGDLSGIGEIRLKGRDRVESNQVTNGFQRPETTKFMTSVAMIFLALSDHERKSIPLEIEGLRKGTFHDICIPVVGFHPFYQKKSIYRGFVTVIELKNVFLIKFRSKISIDGDREKRTMPAEIKLTKIWLEENDRTLCTTLCEIVEANANAQCFFYSDQPIEVGKGVARFQVNNSDFLGVIPDWAIRNEIKEAI